MAVRNLFNKRVSPLEQEKPEKERRMKIDLPIEDATALVQAAFEPVHEQKYIPPGQDQPELPLRNLPISSAQDIPRVPSQAQPSTMERLTGALNAPPLQSDYRPSKLRRFGGAVAGGLVGAGFGPEEGMKVASGITEHPYREAYQDWLTKTGALGELEKTELERGKLETSGLSALSSYLSTIFRNDPELQGVIEGSKTRAKEKELQPGRESLEDIRREREQDLEVLRSEGREGLERRRQKGRMELEEKRRKSIEEIAREQIESRNNIARLNRELRRELQKRREQAVKNQRVPPNQQYVGRIMAEHEISRMISNPEEFEALFNSTKDSSGRVTNQLRPDNEVPAEWKKKYNQRKKEVEGLLKKVLKSSYNPVAAPEEDEEGENRFDIEEIEENEEEEQ